MKVFDVLDPKRKIEGSIFLEAAAGCGKTFAIEHIIARLLIEEGVSFEECLVVTFTKAAALDLKKRIFQTLVNIEKTILNGNFTSTQLPYLNIEEKKDQILSLVQKALEKINQAMISTIHGFCFQFLNEHAYFVNLPLGSQESIEMGQFVKDCLRSIPSDVFPSIWIKQFHRGLETVDESISRSLVPFLGYELDISQKVPFMNFYKKFIDLVLELKQRYSRELWEEYFDYLPCLNGLYTKDKEIKYPKELEYIKLLISLDLVSVENFFILIECKSFLDLILNGKIAKKFEKDQLTLQKIDHLQKVLLPFFELVNETLNKGNIALNLLEFCQARLKVELQNLPLAHPDFLLKEMEKAIADPAVKLALRKKYQAVLIDEFQDTDPLQWNIFEKAFFGSQENKLFVCVGDPKQSIYGFRNADLNTYLKAKEKFSEKNWYILDTNFRSEKKVIEALNECFLAGKEVGFFHFEPSPLKIDYFPIKAKHERLWEPSDKKLGLHYVLFEGKTIDEIEHEFLFSYLASEVISLLDQGIKIDQIAFLVKDRYQGQNLKVALEKKGFTFDSLKTDLLTDKGSYLLILSILEFLMDLDSDQAFKKILFNPYLRKEEYLCESYIEKGFLVLKQQIVENLKESPKIQNLPRCLEKIFSDLKVLETLLQQKNFQAYDELMQWIEITLQESIKKTSLYDLYSHFYELKNKNQHELENYKKRSTSSKESPTIITMHSSKGLEYDVVFVLGLYSASTQDPLFFRNEEDPEKKWGWKKSGKADLHLIAEDMEKMRQFYVAMTRAKKRVYFPILLEENQDYSNSKSISPSLLYLKKTIHKISDHQKLYQVPINRDSIIEHLIKIQNSSFEKVTAISESFYKKTEKKEDKEIYLPTGFTFKGTEKKVLSFSSIAKPKDIPKIESENKQSKGAAFGNFFHAIIEKIIEERFYDRTDSLEFKAWLRNRLMLTPYEVEIDEIYEMIHLTMGAKVILGKYAIKDLPYQCIMPEMKMQLNLRDQLELKGFLDLLIYFDGKWLILDFKTNYLGQEKVCYEKENLKKVIQDKEYHIQAACYQKALRSFHELQQTTDFSESFLGVSFLFVRGLKFEEGIITLNENNELEEIFDDVVLSRT